MLDSAAIDARPRLSCRRKRAVAHPGAEHSHGLTTMLNGSFIVMVDAHAGNTFPVDYGPLGTITARFV